MSIKMILGLYKTSTMMNYVPGSKHDRPEELASGNMCGIRPKRMVCSVMAIPKKDLVVTRFERNKGSCAKVS